MSYLRNECEVVAVQPQFLQVGQQLDGVGQDVQLVGAEVELHEGGDGAQVVRDCHQQVLPAFQVEEAAQPGEKFIKNYYVIILTF